MLHPWLSEAATSLALTNFLQTPTSLTLRWPSYGSSYRYMVQGRSSFSDGLWLPLTNTAPWPITGTEWKNLNPSLDSSRFYRVIAVPAAVRGKLISSTLGRTLTKFEIALAAYGLGITLNPAYDVNVYSIINETIDPLGGRIQASGVVALPQNPAGGLPLVSYQHGTITQTNRAPSATINAQDPDEMLIGVLYASTGYAATLPDYIGLGSSQGLHPFHHARTEAQAALDLLRAARTVATSAGCTLNGQLFLCGYSQGGHATMALHREIEFYHSGEFTITASAPMAGAYDLAGASANDFLSGRAQPNPYYFLYLVASYQQTYRFANTLADLLKAPFNTSLPPLMNGNTSGGTINAAMGTNTVTILKDAWLESFRSNPRHPLRVALQENSLIEWTPRSPMRLFHCAGDQDVVFGNSVSATNRFHARGATHVRLIDPNPAASHGACSQPSMLAAKAWFDTLKQ